MKFIIQCIISLKKRLPFEHTILNNSLEIYFKGSFQRDKWMALSTAFPNILTQKNRVKFTDELDVFGLHYATILNKHEKSANTIAERWFLLEREYPTLSKLAKAMIILPYTTAVVESTFSQFRAFKTCYRNSLSLESLEASVISEQFFKREKPDILPEMIDDVEVSETSFFAS